MEPTRDLVAQLRLMHRVHAALSSSIRPDELYSLILSTLVAPSGLDFSRAWLFLYDAEKETLRGHAAMGPCTRDEADAHRAAAKREMEALAKMAEQFEMEAGRRADSPSPDSDPSTTDTLRHLQHSQAWISAVQQAEASQTTELTKEVCAISETKLNGQSKNGGHQTPHPPRLYDYIHERSPKILHKSRVDLPRPLERRMADAFVVMPLRHANAPVGLVIADRRFHENEAFPSDMLEHVEWYVGQTTMALENARLYAAQQKALDDLRELDKLKSNFLSTVSHELRTPLTAINGFVDLMVQGRVGEMTPTQRDLLQRVRLQSQHLTNIVNDLIEVAEMQMGGLTDVEICAVDPLGCLFNVLPRLEPRRRVKNVAIEPSVDHQVPLIRGNARVLERIYYHLLDNAVKFIEAPTGRIDVIFRQEGQFLKIGIKDTGIGISPEDQRRIFTNFFQVDNSMTRARNGLGLGLTVTKILLDAIDGRISLESVPGQGSTFTVTFRVWREEVDGVPPDA